MLTGWMIAQQKRIAPSPWSAETAQIIRKYAPPSPQADRQIDELTLVAVHGMLMVLFVALLALAGWLSSLSSPRAEGAVAVFGLAILGAFCAGIVVHLIRYYDALICRKRAERGKAVSVVRWPRGSSDADFLIAIAVAVAVLIAVLAR
jgi:hypothetical protein